MANARGERRHDQAESPDEARMEEDRRIVQIVGKTRNTRSRTAAGPKKIAPNPDLKPG
jgi:hypothetical protein